MRTLRLVAMLLVSVPVGTAWSQETVPEPGQLVLLLEYIGADYPMAVRDGKIANAFEYQEMVTFSRLLLEQFDVLRSHGAGEGDRAELRHLQELIANLRPSGEVRSVTQGLVARLLEQLEVVTLPAAAPELERGRQLYADNCAPCHGPTGAGDGFADPAMDPPATSFREDRMNLVSPHHAFGAIAYGIDGTAMPFYRLAFTPRQMWDVAFYVMTLRADFDPVHVDRRALSLRELALHSNEDLLAMAADRGAPLRPAELDYLRQHLPEPGLPVETPVPTERRGAGVGPSSSDDPLRVALQLQDAFSRVADTVQPSVVTVTSFIREEEAGEGSESEPAPPAGEAWRVADAEDQIYPGFRRLRSGSGFFVSEHGHILTCHDLLTTTDGDIAEAIDVELPGGRHVLSRLVGGEPTVNLAVLQLEVVAQPLVDRLPEVRPVKTGSSEGVRVGHWIIALGDPWGPERTYAVGTLAALPQRQCYQEQLAGTLLQASVVVHPEAYGGPLANIRGEVVGMSVPPPDGRGLGVGRSEFALPIELALNLYRALKVTESRRSPWLGFSVLELAAARRGRAGVGEGVVLPRTGVYIDDAFDPSPASRAGIRVGDSLVSIDGNRLFSVLDFQKWLYLSGIGRTVSLELFRGGEILTMEVEIEERPAEVTARRP